MTSFNLSSSIPLGSLVKVYIPKWDQVSTGASIFNSVNQSGALICKHSISQVALLCSLNATAGSGKDILTIQNVFSS